MSSASLKSICIYVHWNKQNLITDADLYTIKLLSEQVDEILVVQNIDEANKNFDEIKLPANVKLMTRPNFGYDFGGFKFGVDLIKKQKDSLGELYLCNNSVFTAVDNLDNLFQKLKNSSFSVCGLTESFERGWHLQSYFLRFDGRALRSEAFSNWWDQLSPSSDKEKTVSEFEIPLASYFGKNGLTVGALWTMSDLIQKFFSLYGLSYLQTKEQKAGFLDLLNKLNAGIAVNPTHKFWLILLELSFPFIKKDLLTGRVHDELGQDSWAKVLDSDSAKELIAQEI